MKTSPASKSHCLAIIFSTALATSVLAVDPPPDGGYPNQNTAEGEDALFSLTTGANNTAIGYHTLHNITDSSGNTAVGYLALAASTAGPNTAVGANALQNNTTGYNNTAVSGLESNTTGHDNTAIGSSALTDNTTGSFNTAAGELALGGNGSNNCAFGVDAMELAGNGSGNVAIGGASLTKGGNYNVAIGNRSLYRVKGGYNIAVGNDSGLNLTGDSNYNIDIGNPAAEGDTNTIRIGEAGNHTATYIAGIRGVTVGDGIAVYIDSNGQLGTLTSSARYKEQIRPMNKSSEAILQLQPVSFRYKREIDPSATPQFGLIAEEVEKVAPELVEFDADGKAYSVRYEAVNAMLLNEFLKEHRKGAERGLIINLQKEKIKELETIVSRLQSSVEKQAATIHKVQLQHRSPDSEKKLTMSD